MASNDQSSAIQIHDQIRLDILDGEWTPGAKLSMGDLSARYTMSSTVVREGLTRLAGERLVAMQPNRGFFVQRLSPGELTDLTELRCRVEAFAIGLSIERGDLEWEADLIATHHRLARTNACDDEGREITREWERAHRAFHAHLISACGLGILTEVARQLSDSTEVYRRWAAPSETATKRRPAVRAEHKAIVDAVVARDADAAAAALRAHYETTLSVLLESGVVSEDAD